MLHFCGPATQSERYLPHFCGPTTQSDRYLLHFCSPAIQSGCYLLHFCGPATQSGCYLLHSSNPGVQSERYLLHFCCPAFQSRRYLLYFCGRQRGGGPVRASPARGCYTGPWDPSLPQAELSLARGPTAWDGHSFLPQETRARKASASLQRTPPTAGAFYHRRASRPARGAGAPTRRASPTKHHVLLPTSNPKFRPRWPPT